jgi:hypothetical protein
VKIKELAEHAATLQSRLDAIAALLGDKCEWVTSDGKDRLLAIATGKRDHELSDK